MIAPEGDGSERQISHLTLPLAFETAFDDEQKIVDRRGNTDPAADFEDAWHRLSRGDPCVGVLRERRHIMRDKHATLLRGPLEDCGVVRSRQTDV